MAKYKIINGDSLEELKKFPDNYFDSIVTDPPYGLGKEPNAVEVLKSWVETGYHEVNGKGFMGKEWDAFVPQPLFWKEVFRVLKHGGHVVSFFGTRTYDWGVMAMRFAGFEVRDCIQWLYGSGFPKSHNISKAIDKMQGAERTEVIGKRSRNVKPFDDSNGWNENSTSGDFEYTAPATKEAKQWDGWGSALKPANEPIVLARKPLEKGLSIAENVLKWGTGAINIDASRIGNELIKGQKAGQGFNNVKGFGVNTKLGNEEAKEYISNDVNGRFPANLILTHHPECECNGLKKVKAISGGTGDKSMGGMGKNGIYGEYALDILGANAGGLGDENGEETVEDWNCHEDCPIKIMDEQSGLLKSGKPMGNKNASHGFGGGYGKIPVTGFGDSGGASRFFYVAKASKSERNKGLDGFEEKEKPDNYIMPKLTCSECGSKRVDSSNKLVCGCNGKTHYEEQNSIESKNNLAGGNKNNHPTVKPVKLIQYLVRLITPPNGKVLDPFNGSGTTGIACMLEGFEYTGIELDPEYCKISEARIQSWDELVEYEHYKQLNTENEEVSKNQLSLF